MYIPSISSYCMFKMQVVKETVCSMVCCTGRGGCFDPLSIDRGLTSGPQRLSLLRKLGSQGHGDVLRRAVAEAFRPAVRAAAGLRSVHSTLMRTSSVGLALGTAMIPWGIAGDV